MTQSYMYDKNRYNNRKNTVTTPKGQQNVQ